MPDAHDGSSQFTLHLNVDESDVGVTAGSMADALTVTGGSLADVSEVSPEERTWELTVVPDGTRRRDGVAVRGNILCVGFLGVFRRRPDAAQLAAGHSADTLGR